MNHDCNRTRFGWLVGAALAALAASAAPVHAEEARDTKNSMSKAVAEAKKPKPKPTGWCRSNECAGKVAGAKNDCSGKLACKSFKKATCEADGMGSWQTGAKPAP